MSTVVIQVGNTDDKLSQREWSAYIKQVRGVVGSHCGQVHFDGGSSCDSPWQNLCIVAEIYDPDRQALLDNLKRVRRLFNQDSVAVIFGEVIFQ